MALLVALLGSARAAAQAPAAAAASATAATTAEAVDASGDDAPASTGGDRELGLRLGVATGWRATAGGVRLAGVFLYQLAERDWFESNMSFTFGSGAASCFDDRDGVFTCNYGLLDGAAIDLAAGLRRVLVQQQQFAPYVRASLGVRNAEFTGDQIRGVVVPVTLGIGARIRVSDLVAVGGDAALQGGVGWFNKGLGWQPQIGLVIQATVDFWLR